MKKFVTLNEYIASLQKIAQKHGNRSEERRVGKECY